MKLYEITHTTRFIYSAPVREAVTELRMRPRDEGRQTCLSFELSVSPRTQTSDYRDFMGNHVHHFDIPGVFIRNTIVGHSIVRLEAAPDLPEGFEPGAWDRLTQLTQAPEVWEMTQPSHFAHGSDQLEAFAQRIGLPGQGEDPLQTALALCQAIYTNLTYRPNTTTADSQIDEALINAAGVCQDYSHILIALCRRVGIPARYVSGYLYRELAHDADRGEDATHAWVEALMPDGLGWVGLDPTNGKRSTDEHIRTAIGRDYADVPPTKGIVRGAAESKLEVSVEVKRLLETPTMLSQPFQQTGWIPPEPPQLIPEEPEPFSYYAQQMQQ